MRVKLHLSWLWICFLNISAHLFVKEKCEISIPVAQQSSETHQLSDDCCAVIAVMVVLPKAESEQFDDESAWEGFISASIYYSVINLNLKNINLKNTKNLYYLFWSSVWTLSLFNSQMQHNLQKNEHAHISYHSFICNISSPNIAA